MYQTATVNFSGAISNESNFRNPFKWLLAWLRGTDLGKLSSVLTVTKSQHWKICKLFWWPKLGHLQHHAIFCNCLLFRCGPEWKILPRATHRPSTRQMWERRVQKVRSCRNLQTSTVEPWCTAVKQPKIVFQRENCYSCINAELQTPVGVRSGCPLCLKMTSLTPVVVLLDDDNSSVTSSCHAGHT